MNLTGRVFCLRRKGRPWKRDSLRTTKRASWTTSTSSCPSRPSSCSSRSPPSSRKSLTTTDGTSSTGWPSGRLHAKAGAPFKGDITESLRCLTRSFLCNQEAREIQERRLVRLPLRRLPLVQRERPRSRVRPPGAAPRGQARNRILEWRTASGTWFGETPRQSQARSREPFV